jgi:hypothetical protein
MKKEILINRFENCLISVYENKNEVDVFHVGYIKEIYDDSFLIQSYNHKGVMSGFILIRNVDVFKISKDTIYLNKIDLIINNQQIINKQISLGYNTTNDNVGCGIEYIIENCKKEDILVTIKLIYEDKIIGKIIDYDDEYIQIGCYTEYGEKDGISLIEYSDIESIYFDGIDERIIKLLIEKRES